jgi:hypothetical protein
MRWAENVARKVNANNNLLEGQENIETTLDIYARIGG